MNKFLFLVSLGFGFFCLTSSALPSTSPELIFNKLGNYVDYSLEIKEMEVSYSGKKAIALAINGGIPGPVLRFKVGDIARGQLPLGQGHDRKRRDAVRPERPGGLRG